MNGTDIPRTIADRIYALLLLAYPSEFRDRFGAGMRYAFSRDRETATAAGLPSHLRFWFTTIIDTVRSGLAERRRRSRFVAAPAPWHNWFQGRRHPRRSR